MLKKQTNYKQQYNSPPIATDQTTKNRYNNNNSIQTKTVNIRKEPKIQYLRDSNFALFRGLFYEGGLLKQRL